MFGKMTLLEMTQDILSSMDSDEVNSIADTVESLQVATEIRTAFFEVFGNLNLPIRSSLIQLEALTDVNRPNYLKVPENVKEISWIKYNFRENSDTDYRDIKFLLPEDFIKKTLQTTESSQIVEDFSGFVFPVVNNRSPQWWTTFDNTYAVFDSFNNDVDTTLQSSHSLTWGYSYPSFELSDDFVPDLDAQYFPQLVAEAKSACFVNVKQVSNSKEEQRATRQRMRSQNDLWKLRQRKAYDSVDYGRHR